MLYLNGRDYHKMLNYCRQCLPQEACGMLGGRIEGQDCRIEAVYGLTNAAHSQERFSMDPSEQFAVLKEMRAHGYCLAGNFHSHPKALAEPSLADRKMAFDQDFRYLILSLKGEKAVLKSFLLNGTELQEEEVTIVKPSVCGRSQMRIAEKTGEGL